MRFASLVGGAGAALAVLGLAASAEAYHFFDADAGGCRWAYVGPGRVDFWVDGSSTLAIGSDLLAEAVNARDRWNDIDSAADVLGTFASSGVDFTDANFGSAWGVGFAVSGPASKSDGRNEVVLDETGDILRNVYGLEPADVNGFAATKRVLSGGKCTITDAFNLLNGARAVADRMSTTVHEFGHVQGLAHSSVGQWNSRNNTEFALTYASPSAALDVIDVADVPTMHPFAAGTGSNRETPEQDDIAGLSALYPTDAFRAQYGAIEGRIARCIDDAPLEGVNVRAVSAADASVQVSGYSAFDGNGDGRYRLEGLPPGEYRLVVEPMGMNGFSKSRMAIATRADGGFATEYYGPTQEAERTCQETSPDAPSLVSVAAGVVTPNVDVRVGGVDLAFVIDDTGSMGDEVRAISDILHGFADALDALGEPFPTVAILTFKDDVTLQIASDDPGELLHVVDGLTTRGGIDCPESANAALLEAGRMLRAGGVSVLFTDADSRPDGPSSGMVEDYYRGRDLTLSVLLSDTCRGLPTTALRASAAAYAQCEPGDACDATPQGDPATWEEFLEPESLGVEDAVDTFAEIAAETGGIFQAFRRPRLDAVEPYVNFGVNLSVSSVVPAVAGVTPQSAARGARLDAVLVGSSTRFDAASTVAFDPPLDVVSAVVDSETNITVELAVDAAAPIGFYDVIVTTPKNEGVSEVAVGVRAFEVRAPAGAEIASVLPHRGVGDETLDVRVRGVGTNFGPTSTVSFGNEIVVNGTTVESAESLIASVTLGSEPTVGLRGVSVRTGLEFVRDPRAFLVAPPVVSRILGVAPREAARTQRVEVEITGRNTNFEDGLSEVHVSGAGVVVASTRVESETLLVATLEVARDALLGFRDVRVDTVRDDPDDDPLDESATLPDGLRVTGIDRLPENGRFEGCIGPGGALRYLLPVEEPFARLRVDVVRDGDGKRDKQRRSAPEVSLTLPTGATQVLAARRTHPVRTTVRAALLVAGDHVLTIADVDDLGGCFAGRATVDRRGRERVAVRGCVPAEGAVSIPFEARAGSRLSAMVLPWRRADSGPLSPGPLSPGALSPTASLISPSGALAAFATRPHRPLRLRNVPLQETGVYEFMLGSTDGQGGCYRTKLTLR